MKLLDRLCDNGDIRDAYGEAWSALKRAQDNVDRLRSLGDERMEREDFVRFLLEELDEANLVSGEDEHLRERKDKLTHADTLTRGLGASERLLSTDTGSVTAGLAACLHTLSQLAELDSSLSPLHQRIDAARIEVDDVAYDLATHARDIGGDPGELERVQSRLHLVERLTRKHRADLEGLLERRESLRAELGDMESLEDAVLEAEATLTSAAARAREVAEALSAARQTSARDLTKLVDEELRDLGMSGARVRFGITAREALCAEGQDEVILLAQTNPGEGFKPIDRVASGGELSRLLLAFKGALSCHDPVCVSVFDEVDTGVGGPTAEVLGRKLKGMAGNRQVLVVTHQPQIAMHAHQHLHVQKVGQRGRTVTRVHLLDARGRREEISRMLGGLTITAHVRQHAEELLAKGAAA